MASLSMLLAGRPSDIAEDEANPQSEIEGERERELCGFFVIAAKVAFLN